MTKLDIICPRTHPRTITLQMPDNGSWIKFSDPAEHPRTIVLQMSDAAYTRITDAARPLNVSPEAYITQCLEAAGI